MNLFRFWDFLRNTGRQCDRFKITLTWDRVASKLIFIEAWCDSSGGNCWAEFISDISPTMVAVEVSFAGFL